MTTSSYESPQLRNIKNIRKPELSPLSTTPKGRSRAVSESYLSSPLRAALNSAKRVLQVSGRSNSAAVDYSHLGNDAQAFGLSSARLGHASFLDSPYRARERRPVFGFDAGLSRWNEHTRSQTLTGSSTPTHFGPKPVRPERPSPEVDLDLIAQPPPAISSARLAASGHLRKRTTSVIPDPLPLAHEDDSDNLKTPTMASCIQFGSRAPLPQFTPRFIFEEFERVYRAEDELLRAKLAEEIPKIQEPKPMIPTMTDERARILREDNLLAPIPNSHHSLRNPGLALAFPVSLPAPVFKPDDLNFRKQASPYRHRDRVDNTSPDRLESSSRMMKLFENHLENTPKTGNHRSSSDIPDPSPSSSLRRLRSRLTFEEESLTKSLSRKPSMCASELFPRTPAFGTRRTITSISKINTPGNLPDERSPDSDDGVDESPQTPSTGALPTVRVGVAAEHDLISTPPSAILETQLKKVLGNREADTSWDTTPSARPRTPETQRRSPFKLGASLGNAASRLAHLREQSVPISQKLRKSNENVSWKHWSSSKPTRETRDQIVGRVLFDEEVRQSNSVGFSSLKQLMGLRRPTHRNLITQVDPLVTGPLLEDLKTPSSSVSKLEPIRTSRLTNTPEDDDLSPCRAYGKRQGTWETGNWTRGDLNLRLPEIETPIEEIVETVKIKPISKTRILRRAARASALAARNAATGLGIRA
ncbi:hypothetical protein DFH28DRAFT_1126365 [Melampsora americana]|nr:hypothetical protein DFH28DRAFT_1126365 [Melampsora americana]